MSRRLELRAAEERFRLSEHIVRIGQRPERQRLAQAEGLRPSRRAGARAASSRRARCGKMKWSGLAHPHLPRAACVAAAPVIQAPSVEGPRMRSSRKLSPPGRPERPCGSRARARARGPRLADRHPGKPAAGSSGQGRRQAVRRSWAAMVRKKAAVPKDRRLSCRNELFWKSLRSPPSPARRRNDRGRRSSAGRCCRCPSCQPRR